MFTGNERIQSHRVNDENIFAMAVAMHVKAFIPSSTDTTINNMYHFKDFCLSGWLYARGCRLLHGIPKFSPRSAANRLPAAPCNERRRSGVPATGIHEGQGVKQNANEIACDADDDVQSPDMEGPISRDESVVDEESPLENNSRARVHRGGHSGPRVAKGQAEQGLRQKQTVQCLGSISESIKRKSVALEDANSIRAEANALRAFCVPILDEINADNIARSNFIRAIRRKHALAAEKAADQATSVRAFNAASSPGRVRVIENSASVSPGDNANSNDVESALTN